LPLIEKLFAVPIFAMVVLCSFSATVNLRVYGADVAVDTKKAKVKLEAGEMLLFNGNPRGAEELFESAVQYNPNSIQAHVDLATVYSRLKEKRLAEREFDAVLKLNPHDRDLLMRIGQTMEQDGNYAEAVAAYRQAITLGKYSETAASSLAFALLAKGDYKASHEQLDDLVARFPKNNTYALAQVIASFKGGNSKVALQEVENVLRTNPDLPNAQNMKAEILYAQGQKQEAISQYEHLIKEHADFFQAYLSLGNLYLQEGQFEQAKAIFEQVPQPGDNDKNVLYGLALAQEKCGNKEAAIKTYERALKKEPDKKQATLIQNHLEELAHQ
jgi:tetratricopeptide (TPR) repeat protein